jgi:hypothetical protein
VRGREGNRRLDRLDGGWRILMTLFPGFCHKRCMLGFVKGIWVPV